MKEFTITYSADKIILAHFTTKSDSIEQARTSLENIMGKVNIIKEEEILS